MNHTYRLVWNPTLQALVAVSENARSRGKRSGGKAISDPITFLGRSGIAKAIVAIMTIGVTAMVATPVQAHTTSVGYELLSGTSAEIWFGTYHVTSFNEGRLSFVGSNGYSQIVSFTDLVTTKPGGLIDGTTNFYSGGASTVLGPVPTSPSYVPRTWQGAKFSNLLAGTYTFTYLPIAAPSANWAPINNAIKSSSFVITAQALAAAATDINTAQGSYLASKLGTTVNPVFQGGVLRIDSAAPTLAQNFTVGSAGGTIDQAGNSPTFTGVVSNAAAGIPGAITIANSLAGGSTTFAAVNTYTGSTTINTGAALALSGNGSIASSSSVTANGRFDIAGTAGTTIQSLAGSGSVTLGVQSLTLSNASSTFSGTIDGAGSLLVSGGTQTLTGANSYSGSTTIASGATLAVANAGTITSSQGVVAAGTLDISGSNNGVAITTLSGNGAVQLGSQTLSLTVSAGTFAGNIAGAGKLAVLGGVETLAGSNAYTGATSVANGATLALTGSADVAASAGVAVNGTLDLSGSTGTALRTLSGAGTVALGSQTLALTAAAGTFDGTITGAGNLRVVAGSQTLTADNTLTGSTTVDSGATLGLSGIGAMSRSSRTVIDGTLDISGTSGTTLNSLAGAGGVSLGTQALTLANAADNFAGVLSGNGALIVAGGVQTLTGANTLSGSTTVANGATLMLSGVGSVATSSAVIANGTLDISGGSGANVTTLGGTGALVLGAQTITLSQAADTFNGVISGSGGLTIAAGTEILTGANTFTGTVSVASGATLRVAGDQNIGDATGTLLLNGGTLATTGSLNLSRVTVVAGSAKFDTAGGTTLTATNAISGGGTLIKEGSGTMVANGTASHAGGTVVNDGVLVLGGANTYTGGTTINGGTLQISADANLGDVNTGIAFNGGTLHATASVNTARGLTFNADSRMTIDGPSTLATSGDISGAGRLFVDGGTLVLGGNNKGWNGGMTITQGVAKVTSASGLGSGMIALDNGKLETGTNLLITQAVTATGNSGVQTDASTTATLIGTLGAAGGSSCFIKSGGGTLNLQGAASLGNGTCVQQGTLRANGVLDSTFVTVDRGAMLRGSGTIHAPISVQGTLAPGNSPGTLTGTGTVSMASGSVFQTDINGTGTSSGPGNYSRLFLTGKTSQFIATGATLTPNLVGITGTATYVPYVPAIGDDFRIVTAEGGVVGRFAPLSQPAGLAGGTRIAVLYDQNGNQSIDLRVVPDSYMGFAQFAGANTNGRSAAAALDQLFTANQAGTSSTSQDRLIAAITGLNSAQLADIGTNLSGEIHAGLAAVAPADGQALQGLVSRQLGDAHTGSGESQAIRLERNHGLWVDLSGGHTKWLMDQNASTLSANRIQLTLGADLTHGSDSVLGLGITHSTTNVSARAGAGSVDDNMVFGYADQQLGNVTVDGLFGIGRGNWESNRSDPLGITGVLSNRTHSSNQLLGIGMRTAVVAGETEWSPYVRATWQKIKRDGFDESAATPAALSLAQHTASGARVILGTNGSSLKHDPQKASSTYLFGAGIGYDGGSLINPRVQAALGGVATEIVTPSVGKAFVQLNVNGTVRMGEQSYVFYGANTEIRAHKTDIGLNAGVRVSF